MRGPHDIGGEAAGPVDTSEHGPEPWQKLVTALSGVLCFVLDQRAGVAARPAEQPLVTQLRLKPH